MRHELECLALIPKDLRCLRHGRLGQSREDAALLDRHRTRGSDHVLVFVSKHDPPNIRLKVGFIPHKLFLQMSPRKLERHESMMVARAARRGKWLVCYGVVSAISR